MKYKSPKKNSSIEANWYVDVSWPTEELHWYLMTRVKGNAQKGGQWSAKERKDTKLSKTNHQ